MSNSLHIKALAILAFGLIASAGCARTPGEAELRFPYEQDSYSQMSDYRAAARSAAGIYVKVTIRTRATARSGRQTNTENRIVSGASGIIMDSTGYVVTAAHIAQSTDREALVQTLDGRELPAGVVHVDANKDVALLKIAAQGSRFPSPAPAAETRAGTPVLALGTPGNRRGVVTVGRVVEPRMDKRIRYGDYGFLNPMRLEMHVEPGHSGGPVVTADGRLVGMIIGFDLRRDNDGQLVSTGSTYAVPVRDLTELVNRWRAASNNASRVCVKRLIHSKCSAPHFDLPARVPAASG